VSVLASAALLGLAWFTAANAAGSVISFALARRTSDTVAADAWRARRLLAIRFLPLAVSIAVAGVLFAPAHLQLEPRGTGERFGLMICTLAAAGLVLLLGSCLRLARVVRASALLSAWARQYPAARAARWIEMPALPGIALAGVLRPRVLIGSSAKRALTAAELDVAIAHELAHRRAHDNLTRVLMLCAPDFFGFSAAARRVERLWAGEAECLADARAVAGSPARATRLASAMIKVARLASGHAHACAPGWSPFHHAALLETRVRLLVGDDGPEARRTAESGSRYLALALAAVLAAAWLAGVPHDLHRVTERLISILP
jgi:Zn-dependent protease with chaperone function